MTREDAVELMMSISALAQAHARDAVDNTDNIWIGRTDVERAENSLTNLLERLIVSG